MSSDVRLDVPLPVEVLEIARLKRAQLLGDDGKVDRGKVAAFVKTLDVKSLRGVYEQYEELRRRRLEERSRYYEPLSLEKDGSPQLELHKCEKKIVVASGGNQCLGGETEIFDPVLGIHRRVDEIYSDFSVLAWDGSNLVIAPAQKPFTKTVDDLYRFTLSNGRSFVASLSHRVLTPNGFQPLSQCPVGSSLFHPPTNLEHDQLIRGADALRCARRVEGSQYDYLACSRSDDERLRPVRDSGQDVFPSRVGAQGHTFLPAFALAGCPENKSSHSQTCRSFDHLSSLDDLHLTADHGAGRQSHASCRPCESASDQPQVADQSMPAFSRPQPTRESDRQGTLSDYTMASKTSYLVVINIQYVRTDVKYDFTVPIYQNYWHQGIISHNSGKTEAGIQELNWCCTGTHPYKRTWDCPIYCRVNSVSWKDGHGKIIIPKLKEVVRREDLKGGSWESGFNDSLSSVGGSMTLQYKNGSFIELMTYDQDPEKHGGVQRHLILCDEEPPKPIYDESLPRLSRYDGRMLITMTPVNGITWTWDDLYDTDNPNVQVFYFPTLANKHLPQQSRDFMEQMYANEPEEALIRLDGVPAERGGLVVKGFRDELHVVEDFPIPPNWVRALAIDPAPAKSHAALFGAVDPRTFHNPSGKHKVYFYKELLFTEGAPISTFCRELVELNDGDFIKHFRIDPHWDWENKASRTEQKSGFNIFKEFKTHIPNLKPALANEESQKGGWIYYEAMKERLIVDLMAKDLSAKVGVQFFRHGCWQTIKQIKKLSYVKPRDPNAIRSKPQIRHKDDDLVDCAGMILVDKVITELRTSEPLSRQTESPARRCPVTGRILD